MPGVRTTCPYCGVGCGVTARPSQDGGWTVSGDRDHPANAGRLCVKGAALAETLDFDDRLLHPEWRGRRIDWEEASDRLAAAFRDAIQTHGPDSVAIYGSGQLLTEDYYALNKFMKGYVGAANIDTNSRLCMASAVAAHKRSLGEDVVPACYEDLDLADLVVIVGSNAAWCHPIVHQRIEAAKQRRPQMKIVVIDPRRTRTADGADLHLPIRAGADVALFNGLLCWLAETGHVNGGWIARHTDGFDAAYRAAKESCPTAAVTAQMCGLREEDVARFFQLFGDHERTVTLFSQGVNQSSSGVDKGSAILNVHLATGRIGRQGAGPFSITGQPNAMGGREVGGLANTLAAHMDFTPADVDRVRRFWSAPSIAARPGLKAVELFDAVAAGRIKALWIVGTNPLASLPDAGAAERALAACPFVAVSEVSRLSVTASKAHLLLPSRAWGEKDGTVTNSERRISRQRAFLPPPEDAKQDWEQVALVASKLGWGDAFAWRSPADIFREHAALSGFENHGERLFDISSRADLDDEDYDAMAPFQWPAPKSMPQGVGRIGGDGRFPTPDGKARMIALTPRPPARPLSLNRPFTLNTGRVRDHWHTMTRTAKAPTLGAHRPESLLEIHPDDAASLGLSDGGLAVVTTDFGECCARVAVTDAQRRGDLFLPMHWNDAFARNAAATKLVNPAVDPISGQPELKATPASVRAAPMAWRGVAVGRRRLELVGPDWATHVRVRGGWKTILAGFARPGGGVDDWLAAARAALGADGIGVDWVEAADPSVGRWRAAAIRDGHVVAAFFIEPGAAPCRFEETAQNMLTVETIAADDLASLLSGHDGAGRCGKLVCSCFGVDDQQILQAAQLGADSVDAIGGLLKAGTNCGSCRPEIRGLLAQAARAAAA